MSSTKRLPFRQWANVHRTERLISIEPPSGYRVAYPEDGGHVIYLQSDARGDAVGGRYRRRWTGADSFNRATKLISSGGRDTCNVIAIGSRTLCVAPAIRPSAMLTRTWIGVEPRGRRGRFQSSRVGATSRTISEFLRAIKRSYFRGRETLRQQARR
jgi:hypothetical protein